MPPAPLVCQAVLDAAARLRSMAYIDLNPLRAGASASSDRAPHTSAAWRARWHGEGAPLRALAGSVDPPTYHVSLGEYQALLRRTAGVAPARTPQSPDPAPGNDENPTPRHWYAHVDATLRAFRRAYGSREALREKAARMGQQWLWGVGVAPH